MATTMATIQGSIAERLRGRYPKDDDRLSTSVTSLPRLGDNLTSPSVTPRPATTIPEYPLRNTYHDDSDNLDDLDEMLNDFTSHPNPHLGLGPGAQTYPCCKNPSWSFKAFRARDHERDHTTDTTAENSRGKGIELAARQIMGSDTCQPPTGRSTPTNVSESTTHTQLSVSEGSILTDGSLTPLTSPSMSSALLVGGYKEQNTRFVSSRTGTEIRDQPGPDSPFREPVQIPGCNPPTFVYPHSTASIDLLFQTRYKEVVNLFRQNAEEHSQLRENVRYIDYSLRLCGQSAANAHPSILVFCRPKEFKSLKPLLTSKELKYQYCLRKTSKRFPWSKPPTVDESHRPFFNLYFWRHRRPRTLLLSQLEVKIRPPPSMYDFTLCGAVVEHHNDDGSTHYSTLGCALKIGWDWFAITTKHSLELPMSSGTHSPGGTTLPEREESLTPVTAFSERTATMDHGSDTELSPQGGHDFDFDYFTDDVEYESLADEEDEDDLQNDQTAEPHEVTRQEKLKVADLWSSGAWYPSTTELLESKELDLDWAVISLPDWKYYPLNAYVDPNDSSSPVFLTKIAESQPAEDTPVLIITSVSTPQKGTLKPGIAILGGVNDSVPSELWVVALRNDQSLSHGHSGAIVVDAETNAIYGHVVGLNPLGEIYISPYSGILQQIKRFHPQQEVSLPSPIAAISALNRFYEAITKEKLLSPPQTTLSKQLWSLHRPSPKSPLSASRSTPGRHGQSDDISDSQTITGSILSFDAATLVGSMSSSLSNQKSTTMVAESYTKGSKDDTLKTQLLRSLEGNRQQRDEHLRRVVNLESNIKELRNDIRVHNRRLMAVMDQNDLLKRVNAGLTSEQRTLADQNRTLKKTLESKLKLLKDLEQMKGQEERARPGPVVVYQDKAGYEADTKKLSDRFSRRPLPGTPGATPLKPPRPVRPPTRPRQATVDSDTETDPDIYRRQDSHGMTAHPSATPYSHRLNTGNKEDIILKVAGNSVLTVDEASMTARDGAEINIAHSGFNLRHIHRPSYVGSYYGDSPISVPSLRLPPKTRPSSYYASSIHPPSPSNPGYPPSRLTANKPEQESSEFPHGPEYLLRQPQRSVAPQFQPGDAGDLSGHLQSP
ncbi:hypothetical protein QBC36DRAFT_320590 [Triangularia setosa]|uniref:Uncharacterized protein n=1 Tax=Triangularia setosa TaxID=2587417 RepID=A0AAN6WED1_9PEZI|nr:hypothetical protein QBC36DRAFT_320590 [Podospora setosa]